MILSYPLPPVMRGDNLQTEIATALGISPDLVGLAAVRDRLEVTVPDGSNETLVAAAVAAHTGAPNAAQQAQLVIEGEARTALQELRTFRQLGRNAFMGLTAADRDRMLYDQVVNITRIFIYAQKDLDS